jgi:hypothetical protein
VEDSSAERGVKHGAGSHRFLKMRGSLGLSGYTGTARCLDENGARNRQGPARRFFYLQIDFLTNAKCPT